MSNLGMYQSLTTAAKAVGGPEILAEMLINKGIKAGIKSQRPVIIAVGLTGIIAGGLIVNYAPEIACLFSSHVSETDILKADRILKQDEELDEIKAEFRNSLNSDDDIQGLTEKINNLAEEMDAIRAAFDVFDSSLFSYLDMLDIGEDDSTCIGIVKNHPGYESYEAKYRQMLPDAEEIAVIRSYISMMNLIEKEECEEDEFQSENDLQ